MQASTARVHAEVNPNGLATGIHFDYIAGAAYEVNLEAGEDPFAGALRSPPGSNGNIGSGSSTVTVFQLLSNLAPDAEYRYRLVASSSAGTATSAAFAFVTRPNAGGSLLADSRGWEMVSPVDKNGGEVAPAGAIAAGGVLQAAADGDSFAYGSYASFGDDALGAPPASQYVASRGPGGWSTANITVPIFSGSFTVQDQGVPYRLFSLDLARGLLLNGDRCRGEGGDCAVANPPLAGTDAPAGYRNYYLREAGGFTALLGHSDVAELALDPAHFDLSFAGASPDLRHVVLSSCAALTSDATEAPLGEGCDPEATNLYEWTAGAGLTLLNAPPAEPGAELAAQSGAVSADGARVYWTDTTTGALYLREPGLTKLVDAGPATFQTASADGARAFYTKPDGHLYRYDATPPGSADLTPSGGVVGVLGTSADGEDVYYLTGSGLFRRHGEATTEVAAGADPSNYPPTTGTARVSADGTRLLFVATAPLTGYDNTDLQTGEPDSQVYLYDAGAAPALACISCNPTRGRPLGPSGVPGAIANGTAPGSTRSYKPRVLSADGTRVFFDSDDALAPSDTNNDADVYEWEAEGAGTCAREGGCLSLISSGRFADGAAFVDASADGSDAFLLTGESLVGADPGAVDLYDARVGGGFPEPTEPIACEGDTCQFLPSEPVDPTLATLQSGPGNPPVRYLHRRKRRYRTHRSHHRKKHRHAKRHRKGRAR